MTPIDGGRVDQAGFPIALPGNSYIPAEPVGVSKPAIQGGMVRGPGNAILKAPDRRLKPSGLKEDVTPWDISRLERGIGRSVLQ